MPDEQVIAALVARRAESAGEADALRARVAAVLADMRRLDAVIRDFDPGYEPAAVRPTRLPSGGKVGCGEMARFILGALREAGEPPTARELALLFAAARGSAAPAVGILARRMAMSLRHQELSGAVTAIRDPGRAVLWMIAD